MKSVEDFHKIVGITLMECQRIEHDIKLIYAGMLKGDFFNNIDMIKNNPLGPLLIDLQTLDNSDNNPYFTYQDYRLLKEIKNIRNWLAHQSYMDFMYQSGDNWQICLERSYEKAFNFYKRMKALGDTVEKIRLDILKRYGRI